MLAPDNSTSWSNGRRSRRPQRLSSARLWPPRLPTELRQTPWATPPGASQPRCTMDSRPARRRRRGSPPVRTALPSRAPDRNRPAALLVRTTVLREVRDL